MADPQEEEDELEGDEDEVLAPAPGGAVEESLDELVTKHPDVQVEEDEEESLLDLTREERLESLSIKAAPKQPNEFVCKNCHLVKHNSQLADRKRELCRDCV